MDNNETVIDSATLESEVEKDLEIILDNEESIGDDTIESLKAKLAEKDVQLLKEAEARRQLTARAKTAEAKAPVKKENSQFNNLDDTAVERKILKSQGMSEELLDELVALSTVRGKSLLDTVSDPLFIALKESKEADAKSAKAKLGVSRGSGTVKTEKSFDTPGLSEEEHKELWKNRQNK